KEVAISTDAIVGFPGESKKQFENTVKLFKEIKFDMAYIAKYSPRPGTQAAKLEDDVKPEEKERRWKILTEILKKTALEKNKKYIGKEVEVLINSKKSNFYLGKTRTYKTIKVQSTINNQQLTIKPGQFVKVKIVDALPWGLKGILR
ncbi:MAG: TRAM domain-containing protein, partial [Candidatus Aenigmarchaeota archaeon]|nr:TRAM domain-containing protein [Candidatus Aenigmarchaeota archaeon]